MSKLKLTILAILLLAVSTACGQCSNKLPEVGNAPATPDRQITVSKEAAESFEQKWNKALKDLKTGGSARLDFTDAELTSFVALKLSMPDSLPIRHPTIWFTHGEVIISGTLEGENVPIKGNGVLVLDPTLTDGKLYLTPKSAQVGRLKLPQSWLNKAFEQANTQLANLQENITVEKFDIREGEILILATRSQ